MIPIPFEPRLLAVTAAAIMLQIAPAGAATRVWVSNAGTDSGACGAITAPCRTFQQAHDNVATGGTISVLNPGDYGGAGSIGLTLTKSVGITNDGVGEAGIKSNVGGAVNILINAGIGDVISLRGLIIDGVGIGNVGIVPNQVGALHIQKCVIRNFEDPFAGVGIDMRVGPNPTTNSLFMSDTLVYNNGGSSIGGGLGLFAEGGSIKAVLTRVLIQNNMNGLTVGSVSAGGTAHVTVIDSTVVGNARDGILAQNPGFQGAVVFVDGTTVVNNAGAGLHADGTHAVIVLGDTDVTDNGTGVSATNGGQVITYGDNENNLNVGAEGAATSALGLF